jgi:hypothetical protein
MSGGWKKLQDTPYSCKAVSLLVYISTIESEPLDVEVEIVEYIGEAEAMHPCSCYIVHVDARVSLISYQFE